MSHLLTGAAFWFKSTELEEMVPLVSGRRGLLGRV